MALRGSIDDVPIADVLQFIHMSGKSGVLSLVSDPGPAWVEFSGGDVVFARGPATPSLGELLVSRGHVSPAALQAALEEQQSESERMPLGRILIARGVVTGETLTSCVKQQICEAMIDIANWQTGEFVFDQARVELLDDIRVDVVDILPLLNLNTKYLLFEAVRLLDERRRETEGAPRPPQPQVAVPPPLPPVSGPRPPMKPAPVELAQEATPMLPSAPRLSPEPLPLLEQTDPAQGRRNARVTDDTATGGIVFIGTERPLFMSLKDKLDQGGFRVLGHVRCREIESQFLQRKLWPRSMVVLWRIHLPTNPNLTPAPFKLDEHLRMLEAVVRHYPGWTVINLVTGCDARAIAQLYGQGVRAVIPMDAGLYGAGSKQAQLDAVFDGVLTVVKQVWRDNLRTANARAAELRAWSQAKRVTVQMQKALQRASIALDLMRVAASSLERATLFLAKTEELMGLGAFGLTMSNKPMAEMLRGLALRVTPGSLLERCLEERTAVVAPSQELGLGQLFFEVAGRPANDRGVLIPLVGPSKTIGVLYGDNGSLSRPFQNIHAIELAAAQAGIAYENVLLRLRLDGQQPRGNVDVA